MNIPPVVLISLAILVGLPFALPAKPRLVVTTDIGGDPDDMQSLIRLLVFSNEFEIEALVASAAGIPGELENAITRPDIIHSFIDSYSDVYPNLRAYDPAYPSPELLRQRVVSGNPERGWEQVGAGKDTPGSDALLSAMLKPDPRPLNISIWGGQTDLAQALWKLKETTSSEQYRQTLNQLRIYDIADQDGIFEQISQNHAGLFYILNLAPEGRDRRESAFRGMYLGGNEDLTSLEWIQTHVSTQHGPLGARYPTQTWTAPNPHGVMKEGDTPSWFYFLDNGLHNPEQPSWGGWGARFQPHANGHYVDAIDTVNDISSARATVWRWREDFQRAFAARMDACVIGTQANHAPQLHIAAFPEAFPHITLHPGETQSLDLRKSTDPDGHALHASAWIYREAGDPGVQLALEQSDPLVMEVTALPKSVPGLSHLILCLSDDGSPQLTTYRRIRVEVQMP